MTNKTNFRANILKYITRRYNLKSKTLLTLYQACVRPILEYGSIIWGDVSQTKKNKLESIQHQCLCVALGVNILSHKKDVQKEANTWPLQIRRIQSLLRSVKKIRQSNTLNYLCSLGDNARLKNSLRKSYFERLCDITAELNIGLYQASILRNKYINDILEYKWKNNLTNQVIKDDRAKAYKDLTINETKKETGI